MKRIIIVFVVLVALLLGGCGGTPTTTPEPVESTPQPTEQEPGQTVSEREDDNEKIEAVIRGFYDAYNAGQPLRATSYLTNISEDEKKDVETAILIASGLTGASEIIELNNLNIEGDTASVDVVLKLGGETKTKHWDLLKQGVDWKLIWVKESLPEPTTTTKQWDIVSIESKITEKNDVWWKYSWILKIQNDSDEALSFDATIEFLDEDGFIIDDDSEYNLIVEPGTVGSFTGYDLIDADVAPNIKKVNAKVRQ